MFRVLKGEEEMTKARLSKSAKVRAELEKNINASPAQLASRCGVNPRYASTIKHKYRKELSEQKNGREEVVDSDSLRFRRSDLPAPSERSFTYSELRSVADAARQVGGLDRLIEVAGMLAELPS